MYSLTNLSRVDSTTFTARSQRDPSHLYTICIAGQGYACSCPAGQSGRCCKHTRALRTGLAIARISQRHKPHQAERCTGMDGWCNYPRRLLWQALDELAIQDEPVTPSLSALLEQLDRPTLSITAIAGLRQMYLCNDCRAWGRHLLARVAAAREAVA